MTFRTVAAKLMPLHTLRIIDDFRLPFFFQKCFAVRTLGNKQIRIDWKKNSKNPGWRWSKQTLGRQSLRVSPKWLQQPGKRRNPSTLRQLRPQRRSPRRDNSPSHVLFVATIRMCHVRPKECSTFTLSRGRSQRPPSLV